MCYCGGRNQRYLLECSGLRGPASLYNRMCIPVYDRQEKGMQRLQLETYFFAEHFSRCAAIF